MDALYVWVRLPERLPGEGIVWHLTTWAAPGCGLRRPACGVAALAWVPWLNGNTPDRFSGDRDVPVELCRPCLHIHTRRERQAARLAAVAR